MLNTRRPSKADATLAVLPQLLGRIADNHPPEEVAPTTKIGDLTRLFHPRHGIRSTVLIWRCGSVLAGVLVDGRSTGSGGGGLAVSDVIAALYAARQQAHIEVRTPYVARQRIGRDATLDDPQLTSTFIGSLSFHPAALLQVARSCHGRDSFSPGVFLEYQDALFLEIWKRSTWQNQRTLLNRSVRDSRCTTTRTIALPEGRAVLYAGYRSSSAPPRSGRRTPSSPRPISARRSSPSTRETGVYCAPSGAPRSTPSARFSPRSLRPRPPRPPR